MTRLITKTFVYLLLFFCLPALASAQVLSATVGVNGLTCSQCSRSVEMQLLKLPFVKKVEMNLEHTEGVLQFKEDTDIDFQKISRAVRDAGFSVRFLEAKVNMKDAVPVAGGFRLNKQTFLCQGNVPPQKIITIRFLGSGYSSDKIKQKDKTSRSQDKSVYRIVIIQ